MRITVASIACVVALAFGAMPAAADVIFHNGVPDLDTGPWSDVDGDIIVADDFVLQGGAETILDIHWWGYYSGGNSPQTDDFLIALFADDGGKPTTTPLGVLDIGDPGRVGTGLQVTGDTGAVFDLYAYSVVTPTITLLPGTTYWISIINDTGDDSNDNWAWAPSAQAGNAAWIALDGDLSWSTFPQECAFYLTNDALVPEPASMTLLGLGLAGLVARARRRKSS